MARSEGARGGRQLGESRMPATVPRRARRIAPIGRCRSAPRSRRGPASESLRRAGDGPDRIGGIPSSLCPIWSSSRGLRIIKSLPSRASMGPWIDRERAVFDLDSRIESRLEIRGRKSTRAEPQRDEGVRSR